MSDWVAMHARVKELEAEVAKLVHEFEARVKAEVDRILHLHGVTPAPAAPAAPEHPAS